MAETIETAIARHWRAAEACARTADDHNDPDDVDNFAPRHVRRYALVAQMHYRAVEVGLALQSRPDIPLA